jgi:hypothetical protein
MLRKKLRKSQMSWETVTLILAMIALFLYIYMFSDSSDTLNETLGPIKDLATLDSCKNKLTNIIGSTNLPNCDGDDYPDTCDPCIGASEDSDHDNMADDCETIATKDNPDQIKCSYRIVSFDPQEKKINFDKTKQKLRCISRTLVESIHNKRTYNVNSFLSNKQVYKITGKDINCKGLGVIYFINADK